MSVVRLVGKFGSRRGLDSGPQRRPTPCVARSFLELTEVTCAARVIGKKGSSHCGGRLLELLLDVGEGRGLAGVGVTCWRGPPARSAEEARV